MRPQIWSIKGAYAHLYPTLAFSVSSPATELYSMLYNLEFIVHVCGVLLIAHVSCLLHIGRHGRVVLLDAALVVSSERVAAEVGVCLVEV